MRNQRFRSNLSFKHCEEAENVPNAEHNQRRLVDLDVLVEQVSVRVKRNLTQVIHVAEKIHQKRDNCQLLIGAY